MSQNNVIRRLRKAKGLTQTELASLINVSAGLISQWETGLVKEITGKTLIRLANALDSTPEMLIGISEGEKVKADDSLPTDEMRVLMLFRALSPKNREIALRLLKAL